MYLHYIYMHVRRCVHTQGRFGRRHDVNACFNVVHERYVAIFNLQVSNNIGCQFCGNINCDGKLLKMYYRICDLKGRLYNLNIQYKPLISRSQCPRRLRPLACCDHGFESHSGHERFSIVCVSCCQVEVSATN
jgi:hypothetical protein